LSTRYFIKKGPSREEIVASLFAATLGERRVVRFLLINAQTHKLTSVPLQVRSATVEDCQIEEGDIVRTVYYLALRVESKKRSYFGDYFFEEIAEWRMIKQYTSFGMLETNNEDPLDI
jgi:hypothetical protein